MHRNLGIRGISVHVFTIIHKQYMHPTKTERYREALRALRMVGNDCIQKRIKAMENGQDVPDDILTRSLKLACKYNICILLTKQFDMTYIAAEEAADIEQHIDHFVSFHSAGRSSALHVHKFLCVLMD